MLGVDPQPVEKCDVDGTYKAIAILLAYLNARR